MEPSYKLFANIHVFISSDIKHQKNAFRCRRSRELISNSWKKLFGTTRALGERETPLQSRGSHTCGASWENVHKVAVRHKNAIELLFGFGVTRKVHSPVWRKREHYGHWHGTIHVPPQPLKNWGNYEKGGSHVTKSLTWSVRPKAAAGPCRKLLPVPQNVFSDSRSGHGNWGGEDLSNIQNPCIFFFVLGVNSLSTKIYTETFKICNTSKIHHTRLLPQWLYHM